MEGNNNTNTNNQSVPTPNVNNQTNNSPTNELQKIAEQAIANSNFKPAPNVNLGNKPIVEQPKVEEPKQEANNATVTSVPHNDSQTIGTIKPDKQKSPIAMIILFFLLIGFILFMDPVVDFVNENFGFNLSIGDDIGIVDNGNTPVINNDQNKENNNQNSNNNNMKLYDYSNTLSINVADLLISNFKKYEDNSLYVLGFSITNNGTSTYTFTKKMYLEFYNSTNTLIDRFLVSSNNIASNDTLAISMAISKNAYDNGTKVGVVFRSDDDYPSYSAVNGELTCKNDKEIIVYKFNNNKLINISDTNNVSKTSDVATYTNSLMNSKININNLDAINGVSAVLTETNDGYMTSVSIDYNTAIFETIPKNNKYYKKDTMPGVIKFEMESTGYTCS